MRIRSTINSERGKCKTLSALSLAVDYSSAGYNVAYVNNETYLSGVASALKILNRNLDKLPDFKLFWVEGNLEEILEDLRGYDCVILDTPIDASILKDLVDSDVEIVINTEFKRRSRL